jgi:hypothetical protein
MRYKQIVSKAAIIIILIIISLAGCAKKETEGKKETNEKNYKEEKKERWVVILDSTSNDKSKLLYDSKTLFYDTTRGNKIANVWIKLSYFLDSTKSSKKRVKYVMSNENIDCIKHLTSCLRAIEYYDDSTHDDIDCDGKNEPIIPQSVGEKIFNLICK